MIEKFKERKLITRFKYPLIDKNNIAKKEAFRN